MIVFGQKLLVGCTLIWKIKMWFHLCSKLYRRPASINLRKLFKDTLYLYYNSSDKINLQLCLIFRDPCISYDIHCWVNTDVCDWFVYCIVNALVPHTQPYIQHMYLLGRYTISLSVTILTYNYVHFLLYTRN